MHDGLAGVLYCGDRVTIWGYSWYRETRETARGRSARDRRRVCYLCGSDEFRHQGDGLPELVNPGVCLQALAEGTGRTRGVGGVGNAVWHSECSVTDVHWVLTSSACRRRP